MGAGCAVHWIRYSDTAARERARWTELAPGQGAVVSVARRALVDGVDRAAGTGKFDRCRRPTLARDAEYAVWRVLNSAISVKHLKQFLLHAGLDLEMNVGLRAVKSTSKCNTLRTEGVFRSGF